MQYAVCCLMTSQILEASHQKFPLVEYGMKVLEQLMCDQRHISGQDVAVLVPQMIYHHFHYYLAYLIVTG